MIKKILELYLPHKKYVFLSWLCMGFVSAVYTIALYMIKFVVDDVLIKKNIKILLIIIISVFLLYIFRSIALFYQNYLLIKISNLVVADLRHKLFKFILNSSYLIFNKFPHSKLLSILTNDIESIQRSIRFLPLSLLGDTLKFLFLLMLIIKLNAKLAALSILALPLAGYPLYVFSRRLRKTGKKSLEEMSELYTRTLESIYAYIIIYVLNIKDYVLARFGIQNENYRKAYTKFGKYDALTTPVMDFIGILGVGILLYAGGRDVVNGFWTAGEFFSFIMAVFAFYAPVKSFSQVNVHLQLAFGALNRIESVFSFKEAGRAGTLKAGFENALEFVDVSFSYGDKQALKNINIKILPTEKIAVVGPTGSGKTTFINMLLGFFKPDRGKILVDGVDINDVDIEDYRKMFSLVPQETIIFDATIKENILLGRYEEEKLLELISRMDLGDFFNKFPRGLNTYVGERGFSLSGGEKQIISILRALLKDPKVLILDEATSNLDSNIEFLILDSISRNFKDITIIQIAHRFSSIRDVQRIVVMEAGTIVQDGMKSELVAKEGLFKSLFERQVL